MDDLTNIIKAALLNYYRFKRSMQCATECYTVQGCIADILAFDKNKSIYDIEVKISASDLLHDKKKPKHAYYHLPIKNKTAIFDKKIYQIYCVPDYLEEKALNFINDVNKNYGLIVFDYEKFKTLQSNNEKIDFIELLRTIKSPKKVFMQTEDSADCMIYYLHLRMSCEMVNYKNLLIGVNTVKKYYGHEVKA